MSGFSLNFEFEGFGHIIDTGQSVFLADYPTQGPPTIAIDPTLAVTVEFPISDADYVINPIGQTVNNPRYVTVSDGSTIMSGEIIALSSAEVINS